MLFKRQPTLFKVRSPGRMDAPGSLGTVALLLLMLLLGVFFGLIFAVYPVSFSAKLAVFVFGAVVLLYAFVAAKTKESDNVGVAGRLAINVWVFLIGACPLYLPFKFGPLPGLNPLRIAFGAVLAIWLYSLITSPHLRAKLADALRQGKVIMALLTFGLLWQLLCSAISDQPIYSLYYDFKSTLPAYLMFLVALTFVRNWGDMQRTAMFLAAGAVVSCAAALIEWRTRTNLFLAFFPSDPSQLIGLEWILIDKSRGGDYRVSGTFSHPLSLAEYLSMVLPVVIMLAAQASKRMHRLLALGFLPVLALTMYLSHTRSALIAAVSSLIVIGLLFGARSTRQRSKPGLAMMGWITVIAAVATAAALSGSLGYLAQGRSAAEAGSTRARVMMLDRTLTLMAEQPVQGYGSGTAGLKIGRLPGQSTISVDSYYITRALESGYVGLALFVITGLLLVGRAALAALKTTGVGSWVLISLATSMFASLVVKTVLSLNQTIDLFYLIAGMSVIAASLATQKVGSGEQVAASTPLVRPRARAHGLLLPNRS